MTDDCFLFWHTCFVCGYCGNCILICFLFLTPTEKEEGKSILICVLEYLFLKERRHNKALWRGIYLLLCFFKMEILLFFSVGSFIFLMLVLKDLKNFDGSVVFIKEATQIVIPPFVWLSDKFVLFYVYFFVVDSEFIIFQRSL